MSTIIETERLVLRQLTADDAEFLIRLLNEPSFIANIGDRQVRNVVDAHRYVELGPAAMYRKHGVGLRVVVLKETHEPVGLCGLLKRDEIEDFDIGYAFLEEHWRRGYAYESARAVMKWARATLRLQRVIGFIAPHNDPSARVLEKLGFRYEKTVPFPTAENISRMYVWAE